MNIDEIHAKATAALSDCSDPESFRAVALRAVVDLSESIVMPLEHQRINIMARRIPADVIAAIAARREADDSHVR